jgi:hypothetical protein
MNLQELKEENRKRFEYRFMYSHIWQDTIIESVKEYIDSIITKAYKEGKKSKS